MQKKNFEKGLIAVEVVPDTHKDFFPSMQGSWSRTSGSLKSQQGNAVGYHHKQM